MISKNKLQEVLKSKGFNLDNIITDPRVHEKAIHILYNSIPIPFRWFVGKKRAEAFMAIIKESIAKKDYNSNKV